MKGFPDNCLWCGKIARLSRNGTCTDCAPAVKLVRETEAYREWRTRQGL